MYCFAKFCRFCLQGGDCLIDYNTKDCDNIKIINKIKTVLPSLILNENLPELICTKCLRKLNNSHNFIKSVFEKNQQLSIYFSQLNNHSKRTNNNVNNLSGDENNCAVVPEIKQKKYESPGKKRKNDESPEKKQKTEEVQVIKPKIDGKYVLQIDEKKGYFVTINVAANFEENPAINIEKNENFDNSEISTNNQNVENIKNVENIENVENVENSEISTEISSKIQHVENMEISSKNQYVENSEISTEDQHVEILPKYQHFENVEISSKNPEISPNYQQFENVEISPKNQLFENPEISPKIEHFENVKISPKNQHFENSEKSLKIQENLEETSKKSTHDDIMEITDNLTVNDSENNTASSDETKITIKEDEEKKTSKKPRKRELIACEKCGHSFVNKANLRRHYKNIHLKIRFKCQVCDKIFTQSESLIYHERVVHLNLRNHECEYCEQKFAAPLHLKIHLRACKMRKQRENPEIVVEKPATEGENSAGGDEELAIKPIFDEPRDMEHPYQCAKCKRQFNSAGGLRSHYNMKHLWLRHKCDECNLRFNLYREFRTHMKHVHPKKFKCDMCKESFASKEQLTDHQKIHLVESCTMCVKSFPNVALLRLHYKYEHNIDECRINMLFASGRAEPPRIEEVLISEVEIKKEELDNEDAEYLLPD